MAISLYDMDWLNSIVRTRLMFDHMADYLDYTADDCCSLLDYSKHGMFSTPIDGSTFVIKVHDGADILILYAEHKVISIKDYVSIGEAFMKLRAEINDNRLLANYAASVCKGIDCLKSLPVNDDAARQTKAVMAASRLAKRRHGKFFNKLEMNSNLPLTASPLTTVYQPLRTNMTTKTKQFTTEQLHDALSLVSRTQSQVSYLYMTGSEIAALAAQYPKKDFACLVGDIAIAITYENDDCAAITYGLGKSMLIHADNTVCDTVMSVIHPLSTLSETVTTVNYITSAIQCLDANAPDSESE